MTPRAEQEAALEWVRLHLTRWVPELPQKLADHHLDLIQQLGAARERERIVVILTGMGFVNAASLVEEEG